MENLSPAERDALADLSIGASFGEASNRHGVAVDRLQELWKAREAERAQGQGLDRRQE